MVRRFEPREGSIVKAHLGLALAAALALAPPAPAQATSLDVRPEKRCYRGGQSADDRNAQRIRLVGSAFTPNLPGDGVEVTRGGTPVGSAGTDASGTFRGDLTLLQRRGQRRRTYTAAESSNPESAASTRILVSAVDVRLRPPTGRPGRRVRVLARGFTTGRRLYAHLVRRGTRRAGRAQTGRRRTRRRARTRRMGRLRGRCHVLRARRRLIPRTARPGRYRLQFDTRRRYRPRTAVRVVYRIAIRRPERRGEPPTARAGWRRAR